MRFKAKNNTASEDSMALKAPLTPAYIKGTIHPLLGITNPKLKKEMLSAIEALTKAEKALLGDPMNPDLAKKMRDAMGAVEKAVTAVKKPDKALEKELKDLLKAMEKYADDHDSKILDKIKADTIGSVPNGLKSLCKYCAKKFTMESYDFLAESIRAKKEGAGLAAIFVKYHKDINVSSRNMKRWKTAREGVHKALTELKKKENKENQDNRVKWVKEQARWADELYEAMYACRQDVQKMMNAELMGLRSDCYLSK